MSSAARGQQPDQRRTRGGHRVGQRGQRTTAGAGPEKDKRMTKGGHRGGQRGQGTTEQRRTRGGQDLDTEPGHRVQGRFQPVWPALFS